MRWQYDLWIFLLSVVFLPACASLSAKDVRGLKEGIPQAVNLDLPVKEVQGVEEPGVKFKRQRRNTTSLPTVFVEEDTEKLPLTKAPFQLGEKVVFGISFLGIEAGIATVTVDELLDVKGRKAYRVVARGNSHPIFSLFYSIDDRMESVFDAETFLPYQTVIKAVETLRRQDRFVVYEREKGTIRFWERKERKGREPTLKAEEGKIVKPLFDPLAAIYYFRTLPLEVGKTYQAEIFETDSAIWRLEIKVVQRERIKTRLGFLETLVVEPTTWRGNELKNPGNHRVWVTDDPRHLVVRVELDFKFGKAVARIRDAI